MRGLEEGHVWPHLKSLDLAGNKAGEMADAVTYGIREVGFPLLERLDLSECRIRPATITPLVEALRAGGCPKVKHLNLSKQPLKDEGTVRLSEALQAGAVPELTELLLGEVGMEGAGVEALAQALRAPGLARLQMLDLSCEQEEICNEGAMSLARAFGDGAGPMLKELNLRDVYMEEIEQRLRTVYWRCEDADGASPRTTFYCREEVDGETRDRVVSVREGLRVRRPDEGVESFVEWDEVMQYPLRDYIVRLGGCWEEICERMESMP